MKNKSGITLIALIITIIVMLILVAVSVQILIKSDLIGTAESAGEAYKTAHGKEQNLKEVTINGKKYASIEEYRKELEGNGGEEDTPLEHSGIIPEGGVYTAPDGTVYEAGDEFPETLNEGDIYTYGNYEYEYKYLSAGFAHADYDEYGWNVKCTKNIAEPGVIISKINDINIIEMEYTFSNNTSLVTVPKIPNTVIVMEGTFSGCTALVNAPKIPNTVQIMDYVFSGCTALKNTPEIPEDVRSMDYTFSDCTALVSSPKIPNSVRSLDGTFSGCTSLVNAPEIPINEGVGMLETFMNCTSLVKAPYIPENVTYYRSIFEGCTSLTGTIKIDTTKLITGDDGNYNGAYYYSGAFCYVDFKAQNITLEGKSEEVIDFMGRSGINYCPDCNGGNCGC